LSSGLTIVPYKTRLEPGNALDIIASYDAVLDCTDTPASRYLISDICVLLGKPLISASALRTEGQLMVLNYPSRPAGDPGGGPCYRCVFPKPPPPESVTTCGEGGILGPVVGIMGLLQALETIKVITAGGTTGDLNSSAISTSFAESSLSSPSLTLFSAYSAPQFRSIKLRTRKPTCAACSSLAVITADALTSGSLDYVQFCGLANPINILNPDERISAQGYAETRKSTSLMGKQHQLIDVREKVQYDLCHLFGSVNIPFSQLSQLPNSWDAVTKNPEATKVLQLLKSSLPRFEGDPVYVVCRLGNDSQIAVKKLKGLGLDNGGKTWVGDIKGGLRAWREEVDGSFPEY
jgi:adenylyltransferase/sulfurtransferase